MSSNRDKILELTENLQKVYLRERSLKELETLLASSAESQLRHWLDVLLKTSSRHTVWCRAATCGLLSKLAVKHGPVVQRHTAELVRWWDARLRDPDLDHTLTEALSSCVGVTVKYGQVRELKLFLRCFFRLTENFERREQVGGASCLRSVLDHMPPSVVYEQEQFGDLLCARMLQVLDDSSRKHPLHAEATTVLVVCVQALAARFPELLRRHFSAFQALLLPQLQADAWKLRLEVARLINVLVRTLDLEPPVLDAIAAILQDPICRYDKIATVRTEIQQVLLFLQQHEGPVSRSLPTVARPLRPRSLSSQKQEEPPPSAQHRGSARAAASRGPEAADGDDGPAAEGIQKMREELTSLRQDWLAYAKEFRRSMGTLGELVAGVASPVLFDERQLGGEELEEEPIDEEAEILAFFENLHLLLDTGRPIPDLMDTIDQLGELSMQPDHPDISTQASVLILRIQHSLTQQPIHV